jgi:succinyl-CoA synthetase alpha subunit
MKAPASVREELEPLFNPRSIAVIGATNDWNKWGFSTFNSTRSSFAGNVYPVNRGVDTVLGYPAYKNVSDIPGPVDLAVFVVPAPSVPSAMEDCAAKGVKAGLIISAGFAETGAEGRRLQGEVVRAARKGGIRFVGPNCMGFWSATSNLRAFMIPLAIREGSLAFVTQGGNVGVSVTMSAYSRGVGFHRYVSCGCTADIPVEDYIEYFAGDPEVKVILTYIEGLEDGNRFIEKVRQVTRKKPVVALKPGRTEAAARAISSHSGELAGLSEIYDRAFAKAGVVRVESPEELLDVAIGFLTQPLPRGRNVAIVTPGGSYGVLCADSCASGGLNVVKLPEETIAALDKIFPPRWSRGNPVDPAGDRNIIAYITAPEKLLNLREVDALIFMGMGSPDFDQPGSGPPPELLKKMRSRRDPFAEIIEHAPQISNIFRSGDESRVFQVVRPMASAFASASGIMDDDQINEFSGLVSAAIASGKIDASFLDNPAKLAESYGLSRELDGSLLSARMKMFGEGIGAIIRALTAQWIERHGKPVIHTTFSEYMPSMRDGFYPYPSGSRAARVLVKLVEYKEYLEREGLFRPD